ncbi:MAG: hypothetical protein DVB27_06295 [Verrucomicrobia bacterium]|nr:MAG: hypothetical protein DVB27_06295 [Verrucomicrobiota bacterium]
MFHRLFRRPQILASALAGVLLATVGSASAGQRKFAYSYETLTAPVGSVEFENWVTWKHTSGDGRVDQFDFRHEFEFGVTDRLQIGLYVADWRLTDTSTGSRATYRHSGVEVIYNLTNPTTDFIGSALYGELLIGEGVIELEGKLLLQKNFGPVTLVYNAIIEAEWEGKTLKHLDERSGEFAQTLGVSYQVNPNFNVGAELLHEVALPEWRAEGKSVVFAGPNASFRAGRFFATVAGLFRVTDHDEEPDVQTRLIFGVDF